MDKIYSHKAASSTLSAIIKSFWLIEDDTSTKQIEKIIPDGYPELIFHYGDLYKIDINGFWELQGNNLLAGQIKNHFFLENTGKRKVFGIKFQPWALTTLFDLNMGYLTNKVVEVPDEVLKTIQPIKELSVSQLSFQKKVEKMEDWFAAFISEQRFTNHSGQKAIEMIILSQGKVELKTIHNELGISERSLERYFKKHVGLSPKYFSRIIRFSNIFKIVQGDVWDWADIFFKAGFYDQSHLIKNFKEFTGEDPSKYGFSEENLANFFLRK